MDCTLEDGVFEFAFIVRLDRRDENGHLRKFRHETPVLETPRSPVISVEELIYGRWQTAVDEVIKGSSGGTRDEIDKIVNSLAQWVFPRGAQLLLETQDDAVSQFLLPERPKPRLKQFLLTSANYAKFYVHVLEMREGLAIPECGGRHVLSPIGIGIVSQSSNLQLPRIVLSGLLGEGDFRGYIGEWTAQKRQRVVGLLGYALEMRTPDSRDVATLWYPAPDDTVEIQLRGGKKTVASDPLLTPLSDVLPLSTVLQILNVLLLEQKLVLVSFRWSPSFLMVLCEALRALMYPFDWHHVYLPAHPELETLAQLHELTTIEVPAPLVAALRVLEVRNEAALRTLSDVFPDINFVDVDRGVLIAASVRVDGRGGYLPALPRRFTSSVASRLKSEFVGGVPPAEALAREAWAERLSEYQGWEFCDETRISRRLMRRYTAHTTKSSSSTTAATVVQSNPWFSGFLASKSQSNDAVVGAASNKPNDGELIVQTAFLEGFVKVFFLYGEFMQAESEAGTFVGGERSFQSDEFIKELTKNSFHGFQASDVDWLKEFVLTQTWDLFLRTVAQTDGGGLFDEACALFRTLSRSPKQKKTFKESFAEEISGLFLQKKRPKHLLLGPRFFVGRVSLSRGFLSSSSLEEFIGLLSKLSVVADVSGSHILFRILEYFSGNGAKIDPAAVPVGTPKVPPRGEQAILHNGWQVTGFRVHCHLPSTSDFDAICRSCGYATGFWRSLRLCQWRISEMTTCTFPCPTCKASVTPAFRTGGGRATLAGFRAILKDPRVSELSVRLLAGTTIIAGGHSFSLEDVVRDFLENAGSLSLAPSFEESDDSSEIRFTRQLSGRSSIDARLAQTRAVERIRDYRKKKLKPQEETIVTVRVVLSSKGVVSGSPPPPRDPRPDTLAPRSRN